MIAGGNDE